MAVLLLLRWIFLSLNLVLSFGARPFSNDLNRSHGQHIDAVATITLHGDTIDCVPFTKQPAFSHPLLRDVEIQMVPSSESASEDTDLSSIPESNQTSIAQGCPSGTVPIRRHDESTMVHARKFHSPSAQSMNISELDNLNFLQYLHEYATAYTTGLYTGCITQFNVWNPYVEKDSEFSIGQLWITGGDWDRDLNTIEVGWQVYPAVYKDRKTRLFIYWTGDSYQSTGCHNLMCPGFVQVSKDVVLGGVIQPISTSQGKQYVFGVEVFEDEKTHNWWLKYEGKVVGYWPHQLFNRIDKAERKFTWGGEIFNSRPESPEHKHTLTQMGSGQFSGAGYGASAFIRNLQLNSLGEYSHPPYLERSVTNNDCYDVTLKGNDEFYFGGPGLNAQCP